MTQVTPENDAPPEGSPPPDPEHLEKSRRERAAEEARVRGLELTNLMLRAGLDPESQEQPMNKLFFEGYKGDLTTEAVVEAAKSYGLIKLPDAPTGEVTDPVERQQTADRQTAATGNIPDGGTPSPDPRDQAVKEGLAVMEAGGSQEAAMGAAFDRIAAAGYGSVADGRKPDPRAQWDPSREDPRRPDLGW